jgi:Sec-independent protein translocase protein TatA
VTLGLIEILLVVLVFLIMGPRRIVDLFRSMGRGVHDFVDTLGRDKEEKKELSEGDREEPGSRG